ncbi:hypothetical protein NicSoilC12_20910 [Arthrobacter sp. NicSoilC12]|nr:hypothetical protein NicSoilC12_20910 [Arthrobacter sp. NicSoilC12]
MWLCWLAMVLDGFDLVVLGTVIPTLIKSQELGFDAVGATFAATVSLVGVGLGALFIAPLSDRFGRRNLLVACVAWFSLFTIAVVFAPNVAWFSTFRLLAGLGLGACLPAALAYMNDYAPAGTAGKSTTRTMTGTTSAPWPPRSWPSWSFQAGGPCSWPAAWPASPWSPSCGSSFRRPSRRSTTSLRPPSPRPAARPARRPRPSPRKNAPASGIWAESPTR